MRPTISHTQRLLRLMGQLAGTFFVVGFLAGGLPWLGAIGTTAKPGPSGAIALAVMFGAKTAIGGLLLAVPLAFIINSIPPRRRRAQAAACRLSVPSRASRMTAGERASKPPSAPCDAARGHA